MLKSSNSETEIKYVVEVNWADRWQIYQRLKELDIPCMCEPNQPLTAEITDSTTAIQLWSVARQLTAPRQDLLKYLERCWKIRYRHI